IGLSAPEASASFAAGQQRLPPESPTFAKDVAPILFARCAPCHRPGGHSMPGHGAIFSLVTYEDVKPRARRIAEVTARRIMPPWLPEAGYGTFSDERRLRDDELETIQRWVSQGAVEGDLRNLPPAPTFTEGWQLGQPDLVLELPEPYELGATGPE